MRDRELPDKELTDAIINAAITVHKTLGPGFLEAIYEEALCIELTFRNIPFERQKTVAIPYRDQKIGEHRLDLMVAETRGCRTKSHERPGSYILCRCSILFESR
jgi:GxxExxY protein